MQNSTENRVYAGFFVRLAAYLVDLFVVGFGLLLIKLPLWGIFVGFSSDIISREFIFSYSFMDIICYVLSAAYFILMTYQTGSTLGKKLFHLKVISSEDRDLTLFEVAFRETVGRFLSAFILYAGYIILVADKEKRGLHDRLSDTYVIYSHVKEIRVYTPIYEKVDEVKYYPGQSQFQVMPSSGSSAGQQDVQGVQGQQEQGQDMQEQDAQTQEVQTHEVQTQSDVVQSNSTENE